MRPRSAAGRPTRKLRLNHLGSPVRPAVARPACVSRMPARKFTEAQAHRQLERGVEIGLDIGQKEVRAAVAEKYLAGYDLDLMTRAELDHLALFLVIVASKVTEKKLAIPLEPYLQPADYVDWNGLGEDDEDEYEI